MCVCVYIYIYIYIYIYTNVRSLQCTVTLISIILIKQEMLLSRKATNLAINIEEKTNTEVKRTWKCRRE